MKTIDGPHATLDNDRRVQNEMKDIRFVRIKEVLKICGKSRSSIYEAINKGKFPKPVKLGRSSAWVRSELDEWAKQCISESRRKLG